MFQPAKLLLAGIASLAVSAAAWAQAPAASLRPSYWSQRVFMIPYRDAGQAGTQRGGGVELLVSRDGVSGWRVLQQAQRSVSGFSFHAPEDGDYWFAVRTLSRRGAAPDGFVHPQLRVVVDTTKPQLTLRATRSPSGVVLRYEATDMNLRAASLKLEQQIDGGPWQPVVLSKPDVAQEDRLIGRSTLDVQGGWRSLAVRGSVADAAGNSRQSTTQLAARSEDAQPDGVADRGPFLPPIDWPSNAGAKAPPKNNPYAAPKEAPGLAGGVAPPPQTKFASAGKGLDAPALGQFGRALAEEQRATASASPHTGASARDEGWNAADTADTASSRSVNALTFDLDYELDTVGPWGVSRVEIWATPDSGRSWNRLSVDPDNRSPARVTVPGAGRYGFRLVVDGANGSVARRPQSGDEPELGVEVDLQPPIARLVETRLGDGNMTGHLVLKWSATDTNLEDRPVGLFYSSSPDGPWSTIATGLGNSGQYTWRLARHVPDRFYVRLEVRDRAGNVSVTRSELPVAVQRPRPQGRLRGARPASDVPGI